MPIDGINASERLVDGSIELFICGDLFLTEALKSLTVRSDHQVLVQRKGHPRGCGPVSSDIFSSYEFAGYEHHSRLGSIIDEGLAANELTRKVSVKAPSFLALADIVAQTDLIAILPSQVALLFRDRRRVSTFRFGFPAMSPRPPGTSGNKPIPGTDGCGIWQRRR
jgi:DNA-binding transcriptional LysR family regulator